jgi:hypothetical protein
MTELREQIDQLRTIHRSARYPGRLDIDLLDPAAAPATRDVRFWQRRGVANWITGLAAAAAVAAIAWRMNVPTVSPKSADPKPIAVIKPPTPAPVIAQGPSALPEEAGFVEKFSDVVDQVVTAFPPKTVTVSKKVMPASVIPTSLDSGNLLRLSPLPDYHNIRLDALWSSFSSEGVRPEPAHPGGAPTSQEAV